MESRDRLIEAAARVYATTGFRGATTRRIADEAGVNEVTIFRLFGSKAALIDEALRLSTTVPPEADALLPDEPGDPEQELVDWCEVQLRVLRARRLLIRKTMGELEERPEVAPCAAAAPECAGRELKRYMIRLYELGFADCSERVPGGRNEEAHAAGAMLMSALLGDAMGRDMMPEMYPQPPERAAALYVRLFLRALRLRPRAEWPRTAPRAGRAVHGAAPDGTLVPRIPLPDEGS